MKTQKKNSAILLCGHGSRSKNYYKNLKEIKRKVQQRVELKVFNCFLEINKPSLEEFLSKNSDKYNHIFVFPFLIFEGNHFKEDVYKLIKKYNDKLKNITLIEKISLIDEILPITFNTLRKKIKKGRNTVLITSSSYSKEKSVLLSLKKYTKALSKKLKLSYSFFHYVGEEDKIIKKLNIIDNDQLSVLLHPILLFQGFLYKKNKKCFLENFSNKVLVTNSLINNDEIFEIIVQKLKHRIFFNE